MTLHSASPRFPRRRGHSTRNNRSFCRESEAIAGVREIQLVDWERNEISMVGQKRLFPFLGVSFDQASRNALESLAVPLQRIPALVVVGV